MLIKYNWVAQILDFNILYSSYTLRCCLRWSAKAIANANEGNFRKELANNDKNQFCELYHEGLGWYIRSIFDIMKYFFYNFIAAALILFIYFYGTNNMFWNSTFINHHFLLFPYSLVHMVQNKILPVLWHLFTI